jgi:DNA-directed RNA polymerase specialized sigma24 family protein
MHYCQACQQQAASKNSFLCLACLERQYRTVVWPQMAALLPAIWKLCAQADPAPVFQARRAFITALSEIAIPPEAVTPLPNATSVHVAQQNILIVTAYEACAQTYRQQAMQASPAWEFWMLLTQAEQHALHDRYILRVRDGFDVVHGRWVPGYFPLTADARAAHIRTRLEYETYTGILHNGALRLLLALQEHRPLLTAVQDAAHMMREEELESLPATWMWLGTQRHASVQRWAHAVLSGWITAQTWLSPSVRKALDTRQLSPAAFFDSLVAEIGQAQQQGVDTPQALLTTGRRAINALRQTGRPRGRPKRPAPTPADSGALDKAALQAWRTKEYAQRSIDNAPLHDVALGPQEQRIWTLHTAGWTPQEIAEELDIKASTVRATILHVHEKLKTGKRRRGKQTS